VVAVVVVLCLSGCATIGGPRIGESIEPGTPTPLHVRAQDPAEASAPSPSPGAVSDAGLPPLPSPTIPSGPATDDSATSGSPDPLAPMLSPAPPVVARSCVDAAGDDSRFHGLSSIARNRLSNRVPAASPTYPGGIPAGAAGRLTPDTPGAAPGSMSAILRNRLRASVEEGGEPEFNYPDIHAQPAKIYHDRFGVEEDHDRFLFPWIMNLIFEDRWLLAEPDPNVAAKNMLRHRMKINIRDPDPDTANFPNGAYTLPKGRLYIENSPLGLYGASKNTPRIYQWEYLIRYGLTDNLEFRIFSNGLTAQAKQGRQAATTGFSPLAFDFKANFWEENTKYHIPAAGLEVYIQTTFGSPAFNAGTQPSMNLLFDQSLPWGINFEYNFGITGVQNGLGITKYQFDIQWAFQREVVKDFDIFVQGFYNEAALPRLIRFRHVRNLRGLLAEATIPTVAALGAGAIWTVNDRLAVFGSYNFGLTAASPHTIALMGFAVAF
jgi:hypothetical protein